MQRQYSDHTRGRTRPRRAGRLPSGLLALAFSFIVLKVMDPPAVLAGDGAPASAVKAEETKEKAALSSAPDFTADGVDGRTYRLRDLLKKGPVFLDFWTTYCKPCMLELPRLQKIWERHREQGFTLLGVVADDQRTAAKIKPTISSKGFKFPNLTDPDHRIGSLYNVLRYPTSILIAPDGKIVAYTIGYNPGDEKKVEAEVLSLLQGRGAPGLEKEKGTGVEKQEDPR